MELDNRINRIVGQLKGIGKMVEEKRDCSDIMQQLSAIKKAIDGLSKEIVVSSVCKNMPAGESKKVEELLHRAIDL